RRCGRGRTTWGRAPCPSARAPRVLRSPGCCSPAPLAPLGQRGPLRAEGGVVAVARVDPRLVPEAVEEPLLDVVEQLGEALRVPLRVAHPAGEQRVACEEVVARLAAAPEHRDRAGGVA